jgi:PAS domain S-box-containing protein
MKLDLRHRIALSFGLAIALLSWTSFTAWNEAATSEDHLAASIRSEQQFDLFDATLAHLRGAESSIRAYAISGRASYLEAYDSSYVRVPPLLDRLHLLGRSSQARAAALAGLEATIREGARIADRARDLRLQRADGAAAESLLATPNAMRLGAEIRTRVSDLRQMERREVAAANAALAASARQARFAVLVGFILSLSILTIAGGGIIAEIGARERARQALADNEAHLQRVAADLRGLYDNAPCGYLTLDANGLISSMNRTELQWLDYSHDEIVGNRRMSDLLPADERASFAVHFDRLKETGRVRDAELDLQRSDGRLMPVHLSAAAVYDEAGAFVKALAVITDRTELKMARDEQLAAIGMLEDALASVKQLSGLLPICSMCKSVRDDRGYWASVEQYVSAHTDAQFSHGVCPDCFPKMFPGIELDPKEPAEPMR